MELVVLLYLIQPGRNKQFIQKLYIRNKSTQISTCQKFDKALFQKRYLTRGKWPQAIDILFNLFQQKLEIYHFPNKCFSCWIQEDEMIYQAVDIYVM